MISEAPEWSDYRQAPIKGNWLKRWLKSRFRYVDYPFVLGYRGFGNLDKFILQGHVFRGMARHKPRKRNIAWKNFVALIKMFLVRTVADAQVSLTVGDKKFYATTGEDGFFEFEISNHGLPTGWHYLYLELEDELVEGQEKVCLKPELMIEDDFEYGLISDIDDTFLVSHVTKFWRKLYVLLTKNAETRKPFKGVVSFYNHLRIGVAPLNNPFFYVSSSEWNLYDFLISFCRFYTLPMGVLQLKEIKGGWKDFVAKGSFSNHDHKRIKIDRILDLYPTRKFVLLGDNGQHDPYIYRSVVEDYPERILAVYIRGVKRSHRSKVDLIMDEIRNCGVEAIQFRRSAEAEAHAKRIGIIK